MLGDLFEVAGQHLDRLVHFGAGVLELRLEIFYFSISRQDLQLQAGDSLVEIGVAHRHRNRVVNDLRTDSCDRFRL